MRRILLGEESPGGGVVVGESAEPVEVAAERFDVLLTSVPDPPAPWATGAVADLEVAVAAAPAAAAALAQVLRATEVVSVETGLAVESMAYSMLQHGEVFRRWLAERTRRGPRPARGDVVRLERTGGRLDITLARPEVHNALDAALRDGVIEAFEVVAADPTIDEVHLRGAGPSFCAGGDLDEFGTATDPAAAHLLRLDRSVGRRVHEHRSKVTAHLHGHCIGAGIEIAAFASTVVAAADMSVRLPEVPLGLIPGAGGTVSIPRRIGRHRTAYLALSARPIDAVTALRWGLIDRLVDEPS